MAVSRDYLLDNLKIQDSMTLPKIDVDKPAKPAGSIGYDPVEKNVYFSDGLRWIPLDGSEQKIADYVVLGGGTAGCCMAEKLSRSGSKTVVMLEAGYDMDDDPLIMAPASAGTLLSDYYWKFFWQVSQIKPTAVSNNNPRIVTGRGFGGSSSVNGMQWVRGTNYIWDRWATVTGSSIWSAASMLPRFKAIETFSDPSSTTDPAVHGTSGPVDVRFSVPTLAEVSSFVSESAVIEGIPVRVDYNDFTTLSRVAAFESIQWSQRPSGVANTSWRTSASTAFLTTSTLARTNLTVKDKAYVIKVLVQDGVAIGVVYVKDDKSHILYAREKIVLTSGIYSSNILMRSGIGPSALLTSLSIPVVKSLPGVGQNLANHPLLIFTFGGGPVIPVPAPPATIVGPNSGDINGGLIFLNRTSVNDPAGMSPRRVQVIGVPVSDGVNPSLFIVIPILLQTVSRGYIDITSDDPFRCPESTDADLTDANGVDLEIFLSLASYINGLHTSVPFPYTLVDPPIATVTNPVAFEAWIKSKIAQTHHWQSSCLMAPEVDGGVVDVYGRVHGVSGLVVADNQIAPVQNDGNTQTIAYMVADVISDKIVDGTI
jgi:choline dehydrogenase